MYTTIKIATDLLREARVIIIGEVQFGNQGAGDIIKIPFSQEYSMLPIAEAVDEDQTVSISIAGYQHIDYGMFLMLVEVNNAVGSEFYLIDSASRPIKGIVNGELLLNHEHRISGYDEFHAIVINALKF